MALVLLLVLVALVLGIIGMVVEGLFYLLVISVVVFAGALAVLALHVRRSGRRRPVR